MIVQADDTVLRWVQAAVGKDAPANLAPPSDDSAGISVYLLGLLPLRPLRAATPPPLALQLRYLVSVWLDAPTRAHQLLSRLVFAALEQETLELVLDPLQVGDWFAFGATPRPCFELRLPVTKARATAQSGRVREPLVVELNPIGDLGSTGGGPKRRRESPTELTVKLTPLEE